MVALDPSHRKNKHPTFNKNRRYLNLSSLMKRKKKIMKRKDHVEQLQKDHEENNHAELQRRARRERSCRAVERL
jgi:hypothetical protein